MVDPVAFLLLPEVGVPASNLFYGEVTQGLPRDVEEGSYWFFFFLVLDVASFEMNVDGILCSSRILLLASSALDKMDDHCWSGGCRTGQW